VFWPAAASSIENGHRPQLYSLAQSAPTPRRNSPPATIAPTRR